LPVEVKEIVSDYLLLTYDIPASQGKLRKRFLKEAGESGAMMYTQSVYLMPWSDKMQAMANELAQTGHAVVWRSQQEHAGLAKSITIKYAEHIQARCQLIEQRLVQIKDHIEAGRLAHANRMAKKTHDLFIQLYKISETFNPPWLQPTLAILGGNMAQIYSYASSNSSTSCPVCGHDTALVGVDVYKCQKCGYEIDMCEEEG